MKKQYLLLMLSLAIVLSSCEKDWLDEKRNIQMIVPTTLADLRLLLNSTPVFGYDYRGIAEVAAGDCYVTDEDWRSQEQTFQRGYIWGNPYAGQNGATEWDLGYQQITQCNVVLEAVNQIAPTTDNTSEHNRIEGGALLFRSRAFLNLAEVFAPPYGPQSLTKAGIHLRMSSDLNTVVTRATVQETYNRITTDLKRAAHLLPDIPGFKTDASRPAAYGLLARCYLNMAEYELAGAYADSALQLYDHLMDFNEIDSAQRYPFPQFNGEVILHGGLSANYFSFYEPGGKIDPVLYGLYGNNDLRKGLFFVQNADSTQSFRGHYFGIASTFSGVATDELYLIRAESRARLGDVAAAMNDVNALLVKRYRAGTFKPLRAQNKQEALFIVLSERRKELLLRGIRWSDLRRLNQESEYAITLTRAIEGKQYKLTPGDERYTFPIPDYVVRDYGMEQNPGWE